MKGDGRVYPQKKSPFWWIAYYHHGREVREVAKHVRTGKKLEATEANLKDAEKFLNERRGEMLAESHGGRAFDGPRQERIRVGDLLDALEADYRLRDKDSPQFKSHLRRVREYFGGWRATEVTADSVAAYIEQLREQEYSTAAINRATQLLRQAYELAMRDKKLSGAPRIEHLSEIGNERQGFFETADFEAVVSRLPEYLKDFSRFGFITGWRKGSIESLRWRDV